MEVKLAGFVLLFYICIAFGNQLPRGRKLGSH